MKEIGFKRNKTTVKIKPIFGAEYDVLELVDFDMGGLSKIVGINKAIQKIQKKMNSNPTRWVEKLCKESCKLLSIVYAKKVEFFKNRYSLNDLMELLEYTTEVIVNPPKPSRQT